MPVHLKAAKSLSQYFEQEKQASMDTLVGTLSEGDHSVTEENDAELVEIAEEGLVPPTRIERATRGLGIPYPANETAAQYPHKQRDSDDLDDDTPPLGFA